MAVISLKRDKQKIDNQLGKDFCIGPTLLNKENYYSTLIYTILKRLYSQLSDISYASKTRSEKEIIDFYALPQFARFKEIIDGDIKKDPSFANSAIIKLCYSIIKNNKLLKELEEVSILAKNSSVKTMMGFQMKNLKEKVWLLRKLKEKKNFAYVQRAFGDEWGFYDLINDKNFKETYIDKAIDELESEDFRKSINRYIELAKQGKKVASKYFGEEGIELQAYYTEDDNAHRILNINNDNENEQVRISDILQQEEDTNELNICYNKKQRIHAYRKGKERYYEFKEGAYYGMESTWYAQYEGGGFAKCTIVINVSNDGITEILEFKINDENCKIPDKWVGYNDENGEQSQEQLAIEENDELYIQGFNLYNAVIAYQKKGQEKTWPSDLSLMNKTKKEDDISSNMEHIDTVEKVAESRNLSFPC